jgi:hypothetical protein
MSLQLPDDLLLDGVINHDLSEVVADCEMTAALTPLDRTDHVLRVLEVAQFHHFVVAGRPSVHLFVQPHCDVVLRRPVQQVQVIVVLESRCVQYL